MSIAKEIAVLGHMGVKELQARYAQVFGEETRGHHKGWLVKRIAWRLQALAEGDLSERARQRAAELANDANLRLSPPKLPAMTPSADRTTTTSVRMQGDSRIPIPGTTISRQYKGRTLEVKVLPRGFEFEGEIYKSLSALAKYITGTHCNGYFFFRLQKEAGK